MLKTIKSLADDHFIKREFKEAVTYYTQAIEIDATSHILYSNRSAAYLALGDPRNALQDAEETIKLAPKFAKGYSRQGGAMMDLKRYESAAAAYKQALSIDSKNANLQKAYEIVCTLKNNKVLSDFAALDAAIAAGAEGEDDDPTIKALLKEIALPEGEENALKRLVTDEEIESSSAVEQIERLCGSSDSKWRNLNPFGVLLLPPEATVEDIKQRYRKLSTLVHPDKSNHPRTRDAFEAVKNAFMTLQDNLKRENSANLVLGARKNVEKEWKKAIAKGVDKSSLGDFEESVRVETLKVFAQSEQRRLQAKKTSVSYKKREREQEIEAETKMKEDFKFEREWQEGTEGRVDDWRDFEKRKKPKIADPSLKTEVRPGAKTALDHLDKSGQAYKKNWR